MPNQNTKLVPTEVIALIESTTYHRSPSGKAIICEIMLQGGYSCIGVGRVIDLDNDNEAIGKEAARTEAMSEVFSYAAVMMAEKIRTGAVESNNVALVAAHQSRNAGAPVLIS